ncbi:MAG: TetR/AcrR family transcriptional regulator [Nocardioides sp.]
MTAGATEGERPLLDAARDAILAVGWKRTTLTDVARRAGVSRMTIYRRWPDMETLLADLMTREWSAIVEGDAASGSGDQDTRDQVVERIVASVTALRHNDLFRRIIDVDPELLLPYLLDRRGRTQDTILELTEAALTAGQATGDIRPGEPRLMSRTLLLAAHGFTLSAHTMSDVAGAAVDPGLDAELRVLVERYLRP